MKLKLMLALVAVMCAAPMLYAAPSAEEIAEQKEAAKKSQSR